MSDVRVLSAGDRALLLELATNVEALAVAGALRAGLGDLLEDVVPGHRTVLVTWPPGRAEAPARVREIAERAEVAAGTAAAPAEVTLDVTYDGADLERVATQAGMSPEEVAARHAAPVYDVAFLGFAPGFAYLVGLDPRLHVPRLESPRAQVPAGSVAIAGPYAGVYPSSSPGGWNLLGHTDATLFDPTLAKPALLEAGMRVRFARR